MSVIGQCSPCERCWSSYARGGMDGRRERACVFFPRRALRGSRLALGPPPSRRVRLRSINNALAIFIPLLA